MSCFGCTGLGSLCENLFRCGTCSIGSIFDCSKTQTIVFAEGDLAPDIAKAIEQKTAPTFKEIIEKSNESFSFEVPRLMTIATIKRIKVPLDDQQYTDRSLAAIYIIGLCTIGDWIKKSKNPADSLYRFQSAYRQINLKIKNRFKERRPLLDGEMKILNQKIEDIGRYGSLAADLLEKVCHCKGNWESLANVVKTPKEIPGGLSKFLSNVLVSEDFKNSLLFSELPYTIQAIFIKAVKKNYPERYVKEHDSDFTTWVKDPQLQAHRAVDEEKKSGSPLAEVQKRLHEQFSPQNTVENIQLLSESPKAIVQQSVPPDAKPYGLPADKKRFNFRSIQSPSQPISDPAQEQLEEHYSPRIEIQYEEQPSDANSSQESPGSIRGRARIPSKSSRRRDPQHPDARFSQGNSRSVTSSKSSQKKGNHLDVKSFDSKSSRESSPSLRERPRPLSDSPGAKENPHLTVQSSLGNFPPIQTRPRSSSELPATKRDPHFALKPLHSKLSQNKPRPNQDPPFRYSSGTSQVVGSQRLEVRTVRAYNFRLSQDRSRPTPWGKEDPCRHEVSWTSSSPENSPSKRDDTHSSKGDS